MTRADTAEARAGISVVAVQGIGCACGGQSFTMNEIYKTYPRVYENDYTFTPERQADIVVINLLANDMEAVKNNGATVDEIIKKASELVQMVRKTYPVAKIIFSPAYAELESRLTVEFEKLGGEDAGYYVKLIPMNNEGKGGHPSVGGHTLALMSIKAKIETIISSN